MSSPLFVHEFGPADGRPLLALHGLTGHGARWRRFAATHLPGWRVIAPDLRGHGGSTWNPPWTLETFAQDVLAVLDDLGLGPVPVMGHSFGGAIAVYLARLAPDRISKVILADPAIGLDPAESLQDAEDARTEDVYATLDEARAAQAERWPFASEEQLSDELGDGMHQNTEDGTWRRRYSPAMGVTAWSEMARPLVTPPASIPTLLVPAKGADFVTFEHIEAFRAALGDSLTVREMDCGHLVYLEHPEQYAGILNAFLD
ncbi:alpha/beta hydrolase [Actinocrispum sp. NPDC049592]|uniref:alpha/beta fold hydrolase n=1 Tax=Actinocrispum sp. NPDC049592 TaxID=3154835 RepID=UPI0034209A44